VETAGAPTRLARPVADLKPSCWRSELASAHLVGACAVGLVLTLFPGPASAFQPLLTEDTGTVAPGEIEVETSTELVKSAGQRGGSAVVTTSVGLRPGLEGHIDVSGFLFDRDGRSTVGGFEGAVGIKDRLVDETEQLPAVLVAVTLAVRPRTTQQRIEDTESAGDTVAVDSRLVLSKIVGPVTLTWNGGYRLVDDGATTHGMLLGLAAEYRATKAVTLVGEVFSEVRFGGGERSIALTRVGAVYAIAEKMIIEGAIGTGLTPKSPDLTVTLGVTMRF